jgi:hypothetical protein
MAIDTRQKRFSMLNFSWVPPVALFEADGSVDADDRAHLLNLYSGITLENPTPPSGQRSRLLLLGVGN